MTGRLERADRTVPAIALMCVALLCFVTLDSVAKHLSVRHPVAMIVWGRFAVHLLALSLLAPLLGGRRLVATRRPWLQIARGGLLVVATGSIFLAVKYLPLTQVYAISFTSPLFVALLAGALLGERVGFPRWLAIAGGFGGVLIVIRPDVEMHWAAVLPMLMALAWALYQIATRALAATDRAPTTLFFTGLCGVAVLTPATPLFWSELSLLEWALLGAAGLTGLGGHFLLIKAYAMAPAAVLAPFAYVQIVWAAILGWIVFGEVPDGGTIAGGAIVIASGLIILRMESRERDKEVR
ncbi:MAG: DMT family transporter [Kiloniellales bacterium]|nr:DMT family transporter [Kiloniellales bacterium]